MQDKKSFITMLSGLAILLFATPTLAIMSVPCGWYLEANAGSSHLSNTNFPGSSSSSGIGGNANLGYKFMPFAAGEVGYSQYQNTSIKDQFGNTAARVTHYSYNIAARGILPIQMTGLELFAKVGVQRIYARFNIKNSTAANNLKLSSGKHSSTGLYLGAGVQYYFIPELAANIQWQGAQGSNSTGTENLYSVGLSFIFD